MFSGWKNWINPTRIKSRLQDTVSHLDVDSQEVRIIAIDSLETIARDRPEYYCEIMNILASFIRKRAAIPGNEYMMQLGDDVQAALTVIGRREVKRDRSSSEIIDLSHVNLSGAKMDFGNFARVNFYQTNFQNASLRHTNLQGAICAATNFSFANLEYANLIQANLGAANLNQANLQNADLSKANLYLAKLLDTDLRSAILTQANLNTVNTNAVNSKQ